MGCPGKRGGIRCGAPLWRCLCSCRLNLPFLKTKGLKDIVQTKGIFSGVK